MAIYQSTMILWNLCIFLSDLRKESSIRKFQPFLEKKKKKQNIFSFQEEIINYKWMLVLWMLWM